MKSWLLASRPKTLTAAVVPVFVGAALASTQGAGWSWTSIILILLSAVCIQIATNLINDAIDFKKGADTEHRIGPQRVTQSGLLSHKQVMLGGLLFLLLAILFGIPLVMQAGWPIVTIGVVSVLMAYSYTGGPFPLAYLGLGDIFVFIFFGLIAVAGTYFISTGTCSPDVLVAGAQIGLLSTVLIAINNLRDVHQDRVVHKRTMAVRYGIRFVRFEIAALIGVSFLLSFYWALNGRLWAGILPFVMLPLGINISRQIFHEEPSVMYNKYLAQSAGLHAGFGLLLSLGLIIR